MTKIINVADLKKTEEVVLIVDDVRHPMKAPTIADFVANMELIEKLGVRASPVDEMLGMVDIVVRAFPTLTKDQVMLWPLDYIQQISEIARGAGGEIVTTDEDKAKVAVASGNDQPAT